MDAEAAGDLVGAHLTKLALNTVQRLRALEGALLIKHKLLSLHVIVVAMVAAGKKYSEVALANPRSHGRGPPHLTIGMTFGLELIKLFRSLVQEGKITEFVAEEVTAVETYFNELTQLTDPGQAAEEIKYARIHCWRKEGEQPFSLLMFHFDGAVILQGKIVKIDRILSKMLMMTGSSYCTGPAPPAADERGVQRALGKLLLQRM